MRRDRLFAAGESACEYMNRTARIQLKSLILVCLALTFLCSGWVQANDSAVEISAGGLKLCKEHRVSMQKENLFISPDLVVVEYEFLNTTKVPVLSEVAFPIPPFRFDCEDPRIDDREFASFKAWADGKPIKVKKEVRVFAEHREVTADLRRAGIDIERFGNPDCSSYDIADNDMVHLKPNIRSRLLRIGALKPWGRQEDGKSGVAPEWEAHVTYHWKQKFPPGTPVRIRHEYKPVVGGEQLEPREFIVRCTDACFTDEVRDHITSMTEHSLIPTLWVSYILTTANTCVAGC